MDRMAGIAGGDHQFVPAVMTSRTQRPGGRERLLFIEFCWFHLATASTGQDAELPNCISERSSSLM
jgi:hypothetical protein